MLIIEQLSKSFGGVAPRRVLNDISLRLEPGEYIAVMGESGSGKSTLLNLIAGLDTPDDGRVIIDGQSLNGLEDAQRTRLRRAKLGFVFQAYHLMPHLSVERNVALPLALNGIVGEAAAARLEEMLAAVDLLSRRRSLPAELSGGEMQRVAVARALAHRPKLVLADEPTGNLDAQSAEEVLALLREQLRRDGAAGILVTHSQAAAATADRVYRLDASGLHPC